MIGHVYFVECAGRIKVGYSEDFETRLRCLRATYIDSMAVIGVIPGTRVTEKALHELLAAHRLKREWFSDCPTVREQLARVAATNGADLPKGETPRVSCAGDERSDEWSSIFETFSVSATALLRAINFFSFHNVLTVESARCLDRATIKNIKALRRCRELLGEWGRSSKLECLTKARQIATDTDEFVRAVIGAANRVARGEPADLAFAGVSRRALAPVRKVKR